MPANTSPIYPLTPNVGALNVVLSTAMTNTKAYDGTETAGTAMALVLTAGANGSRVDSLTCMFTSTNGATVSGTTAATVVRFWLNNASVNTTATNNQLLGEVRMPATTLTALATGINNVYTLDVNRSIPAGYLIYAGTTVAVGGTNAAITTTASAGDY
jgi:hypothetical protein